MRVGLIYAGSKDKTSAFSLGLLSVASFLRANKIDVKLINFDGKILSESNIKKQVKDVDIVGLTTCVKNMERTLRITEVCKNMGLKTIWGGPFATMAPEMVLKNKNIDYVVMGEGELTLYELLRAMKENKDLSKIKGIAFRKKDEIKITNPRPLIKNLDDFPIPSWDMLNENEFIFKTFFSDYKGAVCMETSRGCYFKCAFCTSPKMWGGYIRCKSIPRVIYEINYIKEKFKQIEFIFFIDDLWNFNLDRSKRLCKELIKNKLDINWSCLVREHNLNKDIIKLMKEAGCARIFLGVDSASKKTLNLMNRNVNLDRVKKIFKICKEVGIQTQASIIIGYPEEKKDDIYQTFNYLKNLNANHYLISYFMPLPNTAACSIAMNGGSCVPISIEDWIKFEKGGKKFYNTDFIKVMRIKSMNYTIKTFFRILKKSKFKAIKYLLEKIKGGQL